MKKNKRAHFRHKKKKGKLGWITLIVIGIILIGCISWVGVNDWDVEKSMEKVQLSLGILDEKTDTVLEEDEVTESDEVEEPTSSEEIPTEHQLTETDRPKTEYIEGQELPEEPTYIDGVLIANKQYPLPETYEPGESVEARAAFEELAAEALLSGFHLTAFSTYRSYEYQVGLYNRYFERDGMEEADRYSARPGYSEHQTGLAFDIGEAGNDKDWASERFGDSEAAKWLAKNAHRYGFILRYPEGKEEVTGYMYESWHFRYVGEGIAEDIYRDDLTLEEFLGI